MTNDRKKTQQRQVAKRLTPFVTPFLFTLAFLLYTNYEVLTLASPDQLIRLLLVLWVLLALLLLPVYYVTRNLEWASLLLTVLVFGFFFSQFFFNAVGLIVLLGVAFWQIYVRLKRIPMTLNQLIRLLNAVATSVIVISLFLNFQSFVRVPWVSYLKSVYKTTHYSLELSSPPAVKPDIYYIVLDGYLRSDMLKELYGYDNTEFTTFLQNRKFLLPSDVHSNYGKTAVSIASTLNMDYVDSFSPGLENSDFWWLMKPYLDHSRVRAVLESQGYASVSLSSGWSLTENPTTDLYIHRYPIMLTGFERYMLAYTPLGFIQPLIKEVAPVPSVATQRLTILHTLNSLPNIPPSLSPKFVFVHITVPHPPFVFDQNGDPVNPPGGFRMGDANDFSGSRAEYQKGYIGQIEFLNTQMPIVVDAILNNSKTPPIIIIQADHGSGLLTDFTSVDNTCIKERFSPFAAYYLPGDAQNAIPIDISAVNIFRIIFNQYFDARLPLLENRQYFYPGMDYIYRQIDVTDRIEDKCVMP